MALFLAITGCSYSQNRETLTKLEGHHINFATQYLGLPSDKYTLADKDVYIWGHDVVERSGPISTYGGYSSSGGGFGGVGIVFGSHGRDAYRYYCEIKALSNQSGIIEKVEYKSSAGGCSDYNDGIDAMEQALGVSVE